jgi:hypothetical protein
MPNVALASIEQKRIYFEFFFSRRGSRLTARVCIAKWIEAPVWDKEHPALKVFKDCISPNPTTQSTRATFDN